MFGWLIRGMITMVKMCLCLEKIIERAQRGDPDAQLYIINKYMPLLKSHARQFQKYGLYTDAISLYTLHILQGLPRFRINFREEQD